MAHTSSITYFQMPVERAVYVLYGVTITETDCGAADEVEITGIPPIGVLCSFTSTLTAGSATELTPSLGYSAGFTLDSPDEVGTVISDPVTTAVRTNSRLVWGGSTGSLFLRSTPNAGSDNSITTTLVYKVDV